MQLTKSIAIFLSITICSISLFSKNTVTIKERKIKNNLYSCNIYINKQTFNLYSEECDDSNFPTQPSYSYNSTSTNNKDSVVINFETLGSINRVNFNVIFIKSNNVFNLKYITIEDLFYPIHYNSIYNYPNNIKSINLNNLSKKYLQYNFIQIPKSNLKILKVDTTFEIFYDINNPKSNIIFYNQNSKKCIVATIPFKIVDLVVIENTFKLIVSANKKEISLDINNKNGDILLPQKTFDSNKNVVHNLSIKSNKYIYESTTNQFEIKINKYQNIVNPVKYLHVKK